MILPSSPLSGSSCHKVKVQLQVVLLPKITAIRIDKLPCRGAPHNPTRSIPFGRTHFPGSCPASEDQHVAALPRHNREVSTPV
ncbi:hypothetical protein T12_10847 [Trichinella patagoniensis]|uniref:Uncharacterized protein n=1 Tax=Trichinella patagoniensis TaxID=990121 RepID=A0A0V0YTN2_9BILA|nr:hypothetical protein T12_10847 [Trichinella patagoniensis]